MTRTARGIAVVLALLVLTIVVSLMIGSRHLPATQVWGALLHPGTDHASRIVIDLRVPRTVAAIVVGLALGVSGALIQAVSRNPLGDPGLLGVNAGAAAAVTAGVAWWGTTNTGQDMWFALAGALVVSTAVSLVGGRRGVVDPVRLTLAGVALGAVFTGLAAAVRLTDYETFRRLRGWDSGYLVERDWHLILPVLPMIAAGLAIALVIAGQLNALALGDDLAVTLGARLWPTRLAAVLAIALLAGAATALAGPIAFVGLMVPHVARWITGPDQRGIIVLSALIAPALLLTSDIVGRVVLWPSEVPAGIVTAFVGAPVLIVLVRRARVVAL